MTFEGKRDLKYKCLLRTQNSILFTYECFKATSDEAKAPLSHLGRDMHADQNIDFFQPFLSPPEERPFVFVVILVCFFCFFKITF